MKLCLGSYQGCPVIGDIRATIDLVESVLHQAKQQGVHLVQFPELFLTGYDIGVEALQQTAISIEGNTMSELASLAKKYEVSYGIGYPERHHNSQGVIIYYNSCVVFDSKGDIVINYRKTHLWDPSLSYEKRAFTAGDDLPVATLHVPRLGDVKIGVLICFDSEFPEPARVLAMQGADLILVSTAGRSI